jgi:thioester reductase-like protein
MTKKILITGVTGNLGRAITSELLGKHLNTSLLFLVRANTPEEGIERVIKSLRKIDVQEELLANLSTDQILCGDLGASSSLRADLRLAEVTHVVNCAAMTSFSTKDSIWQINVEDTLTFARMIASLPNVRRFVHVGTAMICGNSPNRLINEDEFPSDTQHFVPYTESKAAAEKLLPEALGNVPLVVVRPSIVVGHTKLGVKPSPSIFWVFRMHYEAWLSPHPLQFKIDVIPSDWVGYAIVQLLLKDKLMYSRYHISSGVGSSCTYQEITDCFNAHCAKKHTEPMAEITMDMLAKRLPEFNNWFGPGNPRMMMRALRLYSKFAGLNTLFDNSRLLEEGISCPPPLTDYLDVCIKNGFDHTIVEQMTFDLY